ncbi:MAG: hypothetical protein CL920_27785 [Deltaproteobacteria bacterium]|nr:hypothetical protein [Deltaproteobacteria bacterium]|tara:strand:- start:1675 stop:2562 length:888 start_codon:yes stop_codon:yes gene_type:complete
MQQGKFYKLSGQVSPMGLVWGMLFGLVAAIPLSFGYAYAVRYIPLVFLNILVSLAFVFVVALVFKMGLKMGHHRNTPISIVFGVILGAITLYLAWAAFLAVLIKYKIPYMKIVTRPDIMWAMITKLIEKGWFSIGSGGRVNGIFYTVLLVGEGLAYLAGVAFLGKLDATDVYCENCKEWVEDEEIIAAVDASLEPNFQSTASTGSEDWSRDLTYTDAFPHIQLSSVSCKKCDRLHLMTAKKIDINTEKDNEVQESTIFENLNVPRDTITDISREYAQFIDDVQRDTEYVEEYIEE